MAKTMIIPRAMIMTITDNEYDILGFFFYNQTCMPHTPQQNVLLAQLGYISHIYFYISTFLFQMITK